MNTMARKKKKNRKSRLSKTTDLPAAAQSYLSKGKFTEAIKAFRSLHKKDGAGRWDSLFRQAFLGRINQLAAKGMGKEALIIYDNMQLIFPDSDLCLHIRLLIGANLFQQAVDASSGADSTLSKSENAAINELFASLLLSGQEQLKDVLSKNSPVLAHCAAAERALHAYCRQDNNDAHAALKEIPFRSPYKNFSLALKGMLAFEGDRKDSLQFFEKIPLDSSFLPLTVPYRHLASEDPGQMKKLSGMDLQIANSLEGLDFNTAKLLSSLDNSGMSPSALYQTFIRAGNCLGKKQLKKICYRILPHASRKTVDFQKRFGKLSTYEIAKLEALTVELDSDYYNIEMAWRHVCDILLSQEGSSHDRTLKLALIYRHIAKLMERDSFEYSARDIEEMLTRSLDFDPEDKETWLKLVNLKHHNLAKRYKLVNSMLATFPNDGEVMTLGIEAAIQRGAFKKASRLAGKLLAADPINPKVRMMLIDAHLAHARKVAKQQKYAIALQECELAASFDRQDLSQGKIQIYHSLLTILSGDEAGGLKLLEGAQKKAANPLLAHFVIRLEAGLLKMPLKLLKMFTVQLKKTAKVSFDKTVILQLFEEIFLCSRDEHMELEKFRSIFTPALKRAVRLAFSMDELKRICQILHRCHYHDLLGVYAKASLKTHRGNPLFLFYQIYAQSNGGKKRLNNRQFDTLEDAWHEAVEMDDKSTAGLLDDFLNENAPLMGSAGMGASPMQLIQKMFGGALAEKLESGETPTEEEIDRIMKEIIDSDFPDEEPESPKKKAVKKINPKQLKLFK